MNKSYDEILYEAYKKGQLTGEQYDEALQTFRRNKKKESSLPFAPKHGWRR